MLYFLLSDRLWYCLIENTGGYRQINKYIYLICFYMNVIRVEHIDSLAHLPCLAPRNRKIQRKHNTELLRTNIDMHTRAMFDNNYYHHPIS